MIAVRRTVTRHRWRKGCWLKFLVSGVFGLLNSKLFHGTSASMRFALGIMGYLEFMNTITAHERGASTGGANHSGDKTQSCDAHRVSVLQRMWKEVVKVGPELIGKTKKKRRSVGFLCIKSCSEGPSGMWWSCKNIQRLSVVPRKPQVSNSSNHGQVEVYDVFAIWWCLVEHSKLILEPSEHPTTISKSKSMEVIIALSRR